MHRHIHGHPCELRGLPARMHVTCMYRDTLVLTNIEEVVASERKKILSSASGQWQSPEPISEMSLLFSTPGHSPSLSNPYLDHLR